MTDEEIDKHVGDRLRFYRLSARKSQEETGPLLDISFQQLGKYERGENRISASKLYRAAQVLGVRVGDFFDGLAA